MRKRKTGAALWHWQIHRTVTHALQGIPPTNK